MRDYSRTFQEAVLKEVRKNLSKPAKDYFKELDVHDKQHLSDIVFDDGVLMAAATLESWAAGQTCGPLNSIQAKAWSRAEDNSRAERDLVTRYETEEQ
jgi:hypothetical protein